MKRGVIISILLHLVLIGFLFVGLFQYFKDPSSSNPKMEVIESYSVDATTLEKSAQPKDTKKPEQPEADKTLEFQEKLKAKEQKRLELEKKVKEERARLEAEKQKLLILEKKQKELKRKKAAEALAEKKRLEKVKKQEAEKKHQEKLKREKEEKARQARLAEEERKAATRRKAELEADAAKEQAKTNSIIDKYIALIRQKMNKNWHRPADSRALVCDVKIKLLPDGSVLDVRVINPSGSSAFDGSVIDALHQAGTFPLPAEKKYRKLFTEEDIKMKFKSKPK